MSFKAFPKLQRLSGPAFVTEKLDGTNACIVIDPDTWEVTAQSRTRIITPQSDNFGFATWVRSNASQLVYLLGPGYHFGEWWGQGIQRGYGLKERRFSLFNTFLKLPQNDIVSQVPLLFTGSLIEAIDVSIKWIMPALEAVGSSAVPGYMRPEGIVIHDTRSGQGFKRTFDYDDKGKGGLKDRDGNVLQKT